MDRNQTPVVFHRGLPPRSYLIGGATIAILPFVIFAFIWFFCRIDVKEGELAVLIRKTGKNPPPNSLIVQPDEKGIQLEVLAEGRHFRNPYSWDWIKSPIIDIPAGKVGVLTRLYGSDLPIGEIVAREGTKGIVKEILQPGRHRINPYAYNVSMLNAVTINPGCVGVQISLVGEDPLNGKPEVKNTFIVPAGTKGVIEGTIGPATYYLNPYMTTVVEVNLQSQRFEMSGEDAVDFLTIDGFPIKAEGTVEYAIRREKAALLTHEVGDMEDVLEKIILPHARGFARIEGSKGPALNYIVGEMRQKFQDRLEEHLKKVCAVWGVEIRSVLIRNITTPEQISQVIRERELAKQTRVSYGQQIEAARSKAKLVKSEKLADQNTEKVKAETVQVQAKILAEQKQQVELTKANQRIEVAMLQKQTAEAQALGVINKAEGSQSVIRLQNEADAQVLTEQSQAFGGGLEYARYLFYTKTAPQIQSVLTNDTPGGLGSLFQSYLPEKK